jgi:HPt (histidine-containing phosphotransfer) domain-containing protein
MTGSDEQGIDMAASGVSDALIFDKVALMEYLEGDRELFDEAISAFRSDIPRRIYEMEALLAAGDLTETGVLAHALKGAADMFAAFQVRDTARSLEKACRESNPAAAGREFSLLRSELTALLAVLEALR